MLRYVLPVLWMTSRLAVMGADTHDGDARRVDTGAESDVYECFSYSVLCIF